MITKHCDLENDNPIFSNKIPDHSVLILTISTVAHNEEYVDKSHHNENVNIDNENTGNYTEQHVYYQRYNVKSIPPNFLNTEESRNKLLEMIEAIEKVRAVQADIDSMYEDICDMYYNEMNIWLQKKNVYPTAKKRLYRSKKPFWNDELKGLWNILCNKEKEYLNSHGALRQILKAQFREAQKHFDKIYRKTERNYKRNKIIEIEEICTSGLLKNKPYHLKSTMTQMI
jgi:hypothetical protein